MSAEMKADHEFSATCTVCGGKFSMADDDLTAIMDSYKVWDRRHKHEAAS